MITATIEVTGSSMSDIELAIEEAAKAIVQGYLTAYNSNDTGSYQFDVTGEEKPYEEDQ